MSNYDERTLVNVFDELGERLLQRIKDGDGLGNCPSGDGKVGSLVEGQMSNTSGLMAIADAINSLASAVYSVKDALEDREEG
jgi:hypothetical protein